MATTFAVVGSTAQAVAETVTRLCHCRVAYTASVGDAASPVYVQAGPHRSNHGQAADYRHEVGAWAERQGIACVLGYWDDDRQTWVQSVTVPDGVACDAGEVAAAVGCRTLAAVESSERAAYARLVESMEKWERTRPEREAAARHQAACDARAEQYRPLYEAARARVRTNRHGQPHRGDLAELEHAYAKACGRTDCYGEYDLQHGLLVLTRLAERGFADRRDTV